MRITIARVQAWNAWICAAAVAVAAWAWFQHYDWAKHGKYDENSFPMRAFATQATWVAGLLLAVSLAGWGLVSRRWRARDGAAEDERPQR